MCRIKDRSLGNDEGEHNIKCGIGIFLCMKPCIDNFINHGTKFNFGYSGYYKKKCKKKRIENKVL